MDDQIPYEVNEIDEEIQLHLLEERPEVDDNREVILLQWVEQPEYRD